MPGITAIENGKLGGRPVGSVSKNTLQREKLRASFENHFIARWNKLLEAQEKDSMTNYKARHYTFDQIIGKATETMKVEADVTLKLDI
ncbi:MAG: hypothetical protein AABW88_01595 [Nanoarchaeota archaeon]